MGSVFASIGTFHNLRVRFSIEYPLAKYELYVIIMLSTIKIF